MNRSLADVITKHGQESRSGERVKATPELLTEQAVTLVIENQTDRRISGSIRGPSWDKQFVGVVFADGRMLWAEPAGFVEGRIVEPDRIELCFVEATPKRQLVSCANVTRQK